MAHFEAVCMSTGTMSGGGSRVSKGRMGCTVVADVDPQQLAELEANLRQVCAFLFSCEFCNLTLSHSNY